MTDTPVPDAAVQIMKRRLVSAPDLVEAMATDLHDAGLLHDPAEVAALRAVADAALTMADVVEKGHQKIPFLLPEEHATVGALRAALDALPPATGPAPPQGEDAEWAARRHAGFQAAIADTDARIAEAAAVPASPQGEDDSEVWIPPRHDCMEHRPDKPCPHCGGLMFHHRTRRCGECGRRRPAGVPAGPRPADETERRAHLIIGNLDVEPYVACWAEVEPGRVCPLPVGPDLVCPTHGQRLAPVGETERQER